MSVEIWAGFILLLGVLIALDLGVLSRRPRLISRRAAVLSTLLWLVAGAGIGALLYVVYQHNWLGIEGAVSRPINDAPLSGYDALMQFATGAVIELSLSLDNIAILTLIFAFYRIPAELVARVLFWGIIVSLVLRMGLIVGAGAALDAWPPFRFVLGAVLLGATVRVLLMPDGATNFNSLWLVRAVRRVLRVSDQPDGQRLFTREPGPNGALRATPLLLVVLVAGIADLTFASDSIPAVFAVTKDPFIAFASNALAVLMMRSLYFALRDTFATLRYMKVSVVMILLFLALKTLVVGYGPTGPTGAAGPAGASPVPPGASTVPTGASPVPTSTAPSGTIATDPSGLLGTDVSAYFRPAQFYTEGTLAVVLTLVFLGVAGSLLHAFIVRRTSPALGPTGSVASLRPSVADDLANGLDAAQGFLWKVLVLIVGLAVAIGGTIIIGPLPGPGGVIVFLAGLGILATEFVWAQRLLLEAKRRAEQVAAQSDQVAKNTPKWVVIPVILGFYGVAAFLWWLDLKWLPQFFVIFTAIGLSFPLGFWIWQTLRPRAAVQDGTRAGDSPSSRA
jgi:tellurite resistance protein TerC